MVKRKASLAFADTSSHGNEGNHTSSRLSCSPNGRRATARKQDLTEAIGSDSDDIDFVEEMHVPSTSAAAMPSSTSGSSSNSSSLAKRGQRYQQRCESKDQEHKVPRAGDTLTQQEEDDIMRAIELSKLEMEAEERRSPVPISQEESFHRRESPTISDRWAVSCSPSSERGSGKSSQSDVREIPQEHIANDVREEMDGSASDLSQDSPDMLTSGHTRKSFQRSGLQRNRFHKEDGETFQQRQRLRRSAVPEPPNLTSLEEFQDTEEEEEEETAEIDVVRSDGATSEAEGFQDDGVPATSLEVFKLVDTRKPLLPREPYYAPRHSNKDAYTKIVYQLIQTYCQRLRRAQAKVLTRVLWGKPVVTGNCYSDSLLHRKRGNKASMFYTLSESDDDQGPTATSQQDNVPSSSGRRKRQKRLVIEDEADSDFEDFVRAGRRKVAPALGKRRLVAQDVVAMLKRDIRPSKDEKGGDGQSQRDAKMQESQSLSQTLVQDQTESPELFAPHPGADQMTVFDFTEDPCYPDNKFSQSKQTDSLIGATDINQASSFAHTNGEVEAGTRYKSNEILMKNCDTDKNSIDGKTAAEDSDVCEGASLDEQTLTPDMHSIASPLIDADIETPSKKNNLRTQNSNHSTNRYSINHANLRADEECQESQEEEPCKSRPLKENDEDEREIDKSYPCTSVPADSSQSGELSGNNTKPALVSFEEARLQYYQEELLSLQQEGSREKEEGRTSDQEDSSGPDSGQNSVGPPSSENIEEQKQSTEDSLQEMLNARLRKNRKPGSIVEGSVTNKKQGRQSCLSRRKTQPLSHSKSASGSKVTGKFESRHLKKSLSEDGRRGESEAKHEDCASGGDDETYGEDADECSDDRDLGGWKEVDEEALSLDPTKEDEEENEAGNQEAAWDGVDGDCITSGEEQEQSDDAEDDSNTTLPHSEDGEEEDVVEEVAEVGSRSPNDAEEDTQSSMIGVECPLCGVQYPIDQIEAHASGCNGLPSSQPEGDGLNQEETQERPEYSQGPQRNMDSSSVPGRFNQRDTFRTDRNTLRPQRGVAIRIVQQELPKRTPAKPEDDERPLPFIEEDSSESFSESSDHLDATLLQFVEDNQIQLRERKRVRVPDRPVKRQKVADGDSGPSLSNGTEATELCFLCQKHVPKSSYAEHVQEEIELAEAQKHSEDTPTQLPRRSLRSTIPMSRAAGGESSREPEYGLDQSVSFLGTTKYPTTEDWEPDSDDSDGDSQLVQEGALFNPRVSESPIKSFRPISKQPMNLIDFQNQFNTNSANKRKGSSRSSAPRFKKGKRGQKRKWKGKRK